MRSLKVLAFMASLFLSMGSMAKTKVLGVELKNTSSTRGQMVIKLASEMNGNPELLIKNKLIQVALESAVVWPKIEKQATVVDEFDTTLMAYQFNKEVARVRAILPFSLEGRNSDVSVLLKGKNIVVDFPLLKTARAVTKKKVVKNANKYDEEYLNALLKDVEKNKEDKAKTALAPQNNLKQVPQTTKQDSVSTILSAGQKENKFSIMAYVGKFVAFLALVLMIFYGVVGLMKKGVLKKGKLGFLNSTKVVEVLNTTYVAPKRNLMVVKAHNQVFLIGNSEKGMQLISELSDVTGLIKNGEKDLSGQNFDTNLDTANQAPKEFKLKEVLDANVESSNSAANGNLDNFLAKNDVEDKVKLSDQIKNKVKGLKSLQ